jgi:23S rRNA (cytidine1920-2'-O)/16S rRNA (cytidine1409-2'-O)-methyltransferase
MKERLDSLIVKKNMIRTRSQAQQLIKEGVVRVNGKVVNKPSFKADETDDVTIEKERLWVGRGAEKLASAHKSFKFSFEDKVVGDMGASTGGFVEYSLYHRAKKVFAVDVGHDQLDPSLREDPRVINLEGINIKEGLDLGELCDLIVVDLSFISLKLVLSPIVNCIRPEGELIVLVKPQFEVGKKAIGKNGIVKDRDAILASLETIYDEFKSLNCFIVNVTACEVVGKTGNQEYFFHCIYEVNPERYSAPEFHKKSLADTLL